MVVIDDHDMIDTGEASIPRDVTETDVSDNESYRYDPDFSPTPNGTSYWRPDLPEDEKPKLGDIFDTFDDGYNMYTVYSKNGRFNIRPTLAHRLKVALMGGYDKVRGTPSDYRNFKRAVNLFIRDRDAQMIVDKMINRQLHVLEFSFEHHVLHDELVSMFWADDTMKCNYAVFVDVVSFDATFRTNKYDFVFVPYTDQDAALRNAVVIMFPESKHRLCMWHITQKLPGKVLGDLDTHSEFRKEFHKLIWNVHIGLEVFENRWNALITRYNLQDNKWLSDKNAIKDRWIPGYFKEYPVCGLMKTTSRSESSNAFFQIFSHKEFHKHTYIVVGQKKLSLHICLKRDTDMVLALKKQTDAEVHAIIEDCFGLLRSNTYKLTQFPTTVKEMKKQLEVEMQSSNYDNNKEALYADLLGDTIPEQVVIKNPKKSSNKGSKRRKSATEIVKAKKIPKTYIHHRWTKEALPGHLLEKRHRYGPCIEETDRLAAEVHATIEDCICLLRSNTDKLTQFLTTVKEMKKQLEVEMQSSNYDNNKEALYADLLGVTVKAKKKPKTTRKVPFKHRTCSKCGGKGHNRRKCTGKNVTKEDELHDVDEVYESDADTASGEDNSSDEDTSVDVETDED
nr:hypothetical protein [Tanacetum cinerariifolium]